MPPTRDGREEQAPSTVVAFSALPAGANVVVRSGSLVSGPEAAEGPNCENCPVPVTGRAELHDEVVHREQLWLTREPDLLEHGPDHLAEPLEGLG